MVSTGAPEPSRAVSRTALSPSRVRCDAERAGARGVHGARR